MKHVTGIQRFRGDKKHVPGWQSRPWYKGVLIRPWPMFSDAEHGGKLKAFRAAVRFKLRRIREERERIDRQIAKRLATWTRIVGGRLTRFKTRSNRSGIVGVYDNAYRRDGHCYPAIEACAGVGHKRRFLITKTRSRAAAIRMASAWRMACLRKAAA